MRRRSCSHRGCQRAVQRTAVAVAHPRIPRPSPTRQEVGTRVVKRGNPRGGDPNRRTAVVRLGTASVCTRSARCGAGSRILAFLDHLDVARLKCTVGQRVAGGATRDVAMQTGGQLSSD